MDVASKIFVLPLGSIEQHGHHLPLSTDTSIIEGVARGLNDRMPEDLVFLPALWCGHSTHHLAFPGTVSITQDVYQAIIVDICESLVQTGARKIFLLNGHGGNDIPVRYALREVKSRHADLHDLNVIFASYWNIASATLKRVRESEMGGMGHACEMETSMMLLLQEHLVHMDRARRDGPKHPSPFRKGDMQMGQPYYMVEEFHEISETGTVGHPDLASRQKGEQFYEGILNDLVAFVKDWQSW
jgi:creatinine amidohydrolase